MRTDNATLSAALRILARDIQSGDGVANACIAEAADRIDEMAADRAALQRDGKHPAPCAHQCEAAAFQSEIRRLKADIVALRAVIRDMGAA